MSTYKVEMYVNGTEDDAIELRKNLNQTVYDEFELGSVFGLNVHTAIPPENIFNRVMALCMVELENGLNENQIKKLADALPAGRKYMQIEFHENNTSAYGFIDAEYYQIHDYKPDFFAEQINAVLDDQTLESPDGMYLTPDGRQFYMGYIN
jgi:hypothetical protein